jgi:hypothetical protein
MPDYRNLKYMATEWSVGGELAVIISRIKLDVELLNLGILCIRS